MSVGLALSDNWISNLWEGGKLRMSEQPVTETPAEPNHPLVLDKAKRALVELGHRTEDAEEIVAQLLSRGIALVHHHAVVQEAAVTSTPEENPAQV